MATTPEEFLLNLPIGMVMRTAPRHMTRERMRWYIDIQPTVAADDGRAHSSEPTIHDDDEYARSQGLPGIIADGMISTNWIAGLLYDVFSTNYLRNGRLRTKYIAPVYEDQLVTACARITSAFRDDQGAAHFEIEVWCEDDTQKKLTVGAAAVLVEAR